MLEDGWYHIDSFSDTPYCHDFLRKKFSSVDYVETSRNDFDNIEFLCSQQDELYHFQHIIPKRQLKRKGRVYFGEGCRYEEDSASISLNDHADAIYDSTEDRLYFRKLRDIKTVFNGIDKLYREATDDEVREFLRNDFIELTEGYTANDVKINNRKRIALSRETLKRFTEEEKKKIFGYIEEYCPQLVNSKGKFQIRNENDLKYLLYGIDQCYYTTPIGKERRLANSIIPVSQGGKADG